MAQQVCQGCTAFRYGNKVVGLPAGYFSQVGDVGHLPAGPGAKQPVQCATCRAGKKSPRGYCTKLNQSGHLTENRMQNIPVSASKAKRRGPSTPASSAKKKKTSSREKGGSGSARHRPLLY
eukprot:COSAG02_NODE_3089_length_7389_cov_85.781481_5_plen_121_part_00